MSVVGRFTDACLRAAAARWPDDIAEDMLREWRAELAAVATDSPGGSLTHAWRRLAFSVSLACSPSVERVPSMSPLRDRLSGVGTRLAFLAMVCGVLLAADAVGPLARGLGFDVMRLLGHGDDGRSLLGNIAIVVLVLGAAAVMMWLARPAARAFPQTTLRRYPFRLAALAVVPLGVVVAVAAWLDGRRPYSQTTHRYDDALGVLVGALVAATLLGVGLWLALRGRRRSGLAVSLIAVLVGSDIAVALGSLHSAAPFGVSRLSAPAWFPLSLLYYDAVQFGHQFPDGTYNIDGYSWGGGPLSGSSFVLNSDLALSVMLCLAFGVWYGWRIVSSAVPVAVPACVDASGASYIATPRVRAFGAILGVVGLGIWAYSTALTDYLNPSPDGSFLSTASSENFGLVGLVVMVSAVAINLAGRGPLIAPLVVAFGVPFMAGQIVVREGWSNVFEQIGHPVWVGWVAGSALIVLALLGVAGAWWLSVRLSTGAADDSAARRALFALAVATALLAPNFVADDAPGLSNTIVVGYLAAGLAWLTAVVLIVLCRRMRTSPLAVAAMVIVPGAAVLYAVPASRFEHIYGPSPELMVPLALVALVVAAVWWELPRRPLLAGLVWGAVIIAAGALSQIVVGELNGPGQVLASALGRGNAFAESYQAGALLAFGVAVGVLAGRRVISPPREAPVDSTPGPAPTPESHLVVA